jgi:hypothetical protein
MAIATKRDDGNTGRTETDRRAGSEGGSASRPRKALTIGAVAKILSQEFDDISISKIRYLEDQKLLRRGAPKGATGCTAKPTSSACAQSCGCSATSSYRCG